MAERFLLGLASSLTSVDGGGPGSGILKIQAGQSRTGRTITVAVGDKVRLSPFAAIGAQKTELVFVAVVAMSDADPLSVAVDFDEVRHLIRSSTIMAVQANALAVETTHDEVTALTGMRAVSSDGCRCRVRMDSATHAPFPHFNRARRRRQPRNLVHLIT